MWYTVCIPASQWSPVVAVRLASMDPSWLPVLHHVPLDSTEFATRYHDLRPRPSAYAGALVAEPAASGSAQSQVLTASRSHPDAASRAGATHGPFYAEWRNHLAVAYSLVAGALVTAYVTAVLVRAGGLAEGS